MVDANQGWETAQALAFIDGIEGHAPELIEQPVRALGPRGPEARPAAGPLPGERRREPGRRP